MLSFKSPGRPLSWILAAACAVAASAAAAVNANPVPADPPVKLTASNRLGAATAEERALLPDDEPGLRAPLAPPAAPAAPAPAAIAPAPPPAPLKVTAGSDSAEFPRYTSLKPAVAFWTKVFAEYSENQSVIHSELAPSKVLEVLDFRGDAVTLTPNALAAKRSREEKQAKARYAKLLKQVHALRNSPDHMTEEQRRLYDLYADESGRAGSYLQLADTLRAQRGLKERTELALQTADRYLPQMEGIFSKYQMPVQLTRLPLVESSFNVEAYSKVGAAGLWQFMPSSARIYMRLNETVDDRRDPWTSTDAAARHLRDDYAVLGSWPLALTAYNHGRGGIANGLRKTGSTTLPELIARYQQKSFGFASRNFYAEFLAASDVEKAYRAKASKKSADILAFDTVETRHYVPYETLRRLCGADDEAFRKLNPAYRPEVIEGKLYVPPGHIIRVPAGRARSFEVGYEKLTSDERFSAQKAYYQLHRVKKGEVLSRIAKSYGVSTKAVLAANGLKSAKKIHAGQTIKIPPRIEARPGPVNLAVGESKPQQTRVQKIASAESRGTPRTHRVKSGQTLSSIAKRYGVSVASLREANNLGKSSHIRPGQRLKVPTEG